MCNVSLLFNFVKTETSQEKHLKTFKLVPKSLEELFRFSHHLSAGFSQTDQTAINLIDDLNNVSQSVEWRRHTNAAVAIDDAKTTATLTLGGQTMQVQGSGVGFSAKDATDQPNPGVTVLCVALATGGTQSLQVPFNPQWSGMSASDFKTPGSVSIDQQSPAGNN
ncbi:hypothetical protein FRC10_006699 [Ceratobasidium sp. 414]|nr:hypothetical protein FRC10_006699 [Ceratobasidium sp. 414]